MSNNKTAFSLAGVTPEIRQVCKADMGGDVSVSFIAVFRRPSRKQGLEIRRLVTKWGKDLSETLQDIQGALAVDEAMNDVVKDWLVRLEDIKSLDGKPVKYSIDLLGAVLDDTGYKKAIVEALVGASSSTMVEESRLGNL